MIYPKDWVGYANAIVALSEKIVTESSLPDPNPWRLKRLSNTVIELAKEYQRVKKTLPDNLCKQ